ncbi:MAG: S8 family serine peptidase [Chitinophagales bacterium]|nr:S8 family serine peptidase [Chitinophagales bacterium]
MKHIFTLVFSLFIICVNGQILNKIDMRLSKAPVHQPQNVVIMMKDQTDISSVHTIYSKDAKATYVYKQLYQKANRTQQDILRILQNQNIRHRSFYIVNMIAASCDYDMIQRLSDRDDVAYIIEDSKFTMHQMPERDQTNSGGERTPIWGLNKIGAPSVWALGYTGQGVVVGGQDTGYAWEINTIKAKYRGWDGAIADHDYNWHDAIHSNANPNNPCGYDSPEPCDDHNHGTHTMGTMVGSLDNNGDDIGVAPGAQWIGCRNMDEGDGTLTTYVECFEWFLAPYPVGGGSGDPTKMPHVINNSWGCPPVEGCNTTNFDVMELALNNLRDAGCVIVVSAGNSGSACETVNDPAAIFEGSFTIGATNSSDVIADFSSRGAVTVDGSGRSKPNVSAPGVGIRSCIKNGTFANSSGTSMAGPHVAGLVALMISANPNLAGNVDLIETIIEQTSTPLTTTQNCNGIPGASSPNNTYGYGRINATAAIEMVLPENYTPYVLLDKSIVVNDKNAGIVLTSANNHIFRMSVTNSGTLNITELGVPNEHSVFIKDASLRLTDSITKIIMRSPDDQYWQLEMNNDGSFSTTAIAMLPDHTEVTSGDLVIQSTTKGLLMTSPNNTCFISKISNRGVLVSFPATCLN